MLNSACLFIVVVSGFAQPLSEDQLEQARAWIEAMKTTRRGPYRGVSWFCKDGTVLKPEPYACQDHGGGVQYGVLSIEAQKLARWGIHVGTVLTSLEAGALVPHNYYRARALVVEYYLERALDGWVLRQAKKYRGFRQVENEVESARWLLIDVAARSDVLVKHRNLLVRLIRTLPYGKGGDRANDVRALAGVIGDLDTRGFGDLRFKIHAMPEPSDIDAVEAYAEVKEQEEQKALADKARELAQKMRDYYEPTHRLERLKDVKRWVRDRTTRAKIDEFAAIDTHDTFALIRGGTELIETADRAIVPGLGMKQGERNLLLFHVMAIVEELWIGVTADFAKRPLKRVELLEMLELLIRSAGPIGWFSKREKETALAGLESMRAARPDSSQVETLLTQADPLGGLFAQTAVAQQIVPKGYWARPADYASGLKSISRILEWARARLLADIGVALPRYVAVEPRARSVIDDQLRSGVMLPIAALLDRLAADVERLRGGGHMLVGVTGVGTSSLRGENAGLATGPLRVLQAHEPPKNLRRNEIVLLFDLPPELPPVAGILTIGSAGSLSHVSLLARNLGIPHAAIGGEVASGLSKLSGRTIVLGVSSGGRVIVGPAAELPSEAHSLIKEQPDLDQPSLSIDETALDLTTRRIHTLSEISEKDSGVIVGPKAAQLGRLKRLFPARVSDAAVIPFAAFVAHVDRPGPDGSPSPMAALRQAYARARSMSAKQGEEHVLAELARLRNAIATLPFPDGFAEQVDEALARLGRPGTFGVFVRSDTNCEDLKEFTGAGLNLTVPNRVQREDILAAIRAVWASPFTERSFRWRQRILKNPEHVYPSVILHKTVPSEISGVLVTTDLETGDPKALTVSASEGVAAVVDGGAPETIVVQEDGAIRLVASSRSAICKTIPRPPRQGIVRVEAQGRDPLLGDAEISELRQLAAEVKGKIPSPDGLPWDIEFGFSGGRAYLMQIRPLKIAKAAAVHPFLRAMDKRATLPHRTLDLSKEVPR